MLVFVSDENSSDTSKPFFGIDPLTDGVPAGGVPFLFDLFKDFEASHAAAAYLNGDVISDLSETADGAFSISSAPQTITSNATFGGADFSAVTAVGNAVRAPIGALNDINDGSQYFAVAAWVVLPSSADWNTSAALAPFFCSTAGATGYATPEADICTLAFLGTGAGNITARRQTNGATVTQMNLTVSAAGRGRLALVMFWRNAAGIGLRVKTSLTDQTVTGAVGAANVTDFSNAQARWGVTTSFTPAVDIAKLGNWSLCKGWIENLQVSGRDPTTVFDAEYARILARFPSL